MTDEPKFEDGDFEVGIQVLKKWYGEVPSREQMIDVIGTLARHFELTE